PAEEVVDSITSAGGNAVADTTDVTDHDACARLVGSTVERLGRLDILVNTAGILRDRMIFNLNEADWDAVIAVHLKGTYNTVHHAARYWREQREGDYRLVNFTSG